MTELFESTIDHSTLCRLTAEWALKPPGADWLALYEYQSFASQEFPDVLTYSPAGTTLYEIKTSHADFLADQKKEARILRARCGAYSGIYTDVQDIRNRFRKKTDALYVDKRFTRKLDKIETFCNYYVSEDKSYQQAPHLGQRRYYVCEPGVIKEAEVPKSWGLIYFEKNKFRTIMKSDRWKSDMRTERDLIAHALRRYTSGNSTGIMVRIYEVNNGAFKVEQRVQI